MRIDFQGLKVYNLDLFELRARPKGMKCGLWLSFTNLTSRIREDFSAHEVCPGWQCILCSSPEQCFGFVGNFKVLEDLPKILRLRQN